MSAVGVDFALATEEPSIAYQIWMRVRKEPGLASGLTVEKIHQLAEFRHVNKNAVSAAVTGLCKRGFLEVSDRVGNSLVYRAGPAFDDPTLKFGNRVVGGTRDRKPGYKQKRGGVPEFSLSPQYGLDLGVSRARDDVRAKQLGIARSLPKVVLEQALAEKRAAAARSGT